MKKILVTGSEGLMGCHLVPHLQKCGHDVVTHSRNGQSKVHADLSLGDQVSSVLDGVAPEVIINLVGLTNVDECERSPQKAYFANVLSVENLAKWIRKNGTGCHLVHISTDQVYDGAALHDEDDVNLTNYYAFSKYAGELVAASVCGSILRTSFFGPSKCLGRMSLSDWFVQSLKQRSSITAFDDVKFSPLSLQRLVELVELVSVNRQPGIFNLGTKNGMSKADFAFMLAETLDLPTNTIKRGFSDSLKLEAYRPKDMRMNLSRFENTFGVQLPNLKEEIYSMKAAYAE